MGRVMFVWAFEANWKNSAQPFLSTSLVLESRSVNSCCHFNWNYRRPPVAISRKIIAENEKKSAHSESLHKKYMRRHILVSFYGLRLKQFCKFPAQSSWVKQEKSASCSQTQMKANPPHVYMTHAGPYWTAAVMSWRPRSIVPCLPHSVLQCFYLNLSLARQIACVPLSQHNLK